MRKRLYEILEVSMGNDCLSKAYDCFMMITILISLVPLVVKEQTTLFVNIDRVTVIIFIADYLLRLLTADLKLKKGKLSFFIYPFTRLALIDLMSILPSVTVLNSGLKVLKIFRLFRTFRVFKVLKVFKAARYSKNLIIIISIFKKERDSLLVVLYVAATYIIISAMIVFNVEPQTFNTFFDAIYWATVSLTTVGYGDIYPVSMAGKTITMISALMGIAVVALPASILTAGFMDELKSKKKHSDD